MQQYTDGVRLRIEALENQELMKAAIAAIAAPFRWHELSRDLQKQIGRLHLAIAAGRARDFSEILQYPLDHDFWTEVVRYNIIASDFALNIYGRLLTSL
jgi:hypothetical protein